MKMNTKQKWLAYSLSLMLCLACVGKVNGQLSFIDSPTGYENAFVGYTNVTPISIGGILYMQYRNNAGGYDLAKYDGTTLTIIPSPSGYENSGRGYTSYPIEMGGNLYMRYWGNDGNLDLAKYDGTTLTIIPSPTGYENNGAGYTSNAQPIVIGSTLYMQYRNNTGNNVLAKYNGTTLTIIPSPTGFENAGHGYIGSNVAMGGVLYMLYAGNDNNDDLAKYDGTTLTIIDSPAGYENAFCGYGSNPIVIGSTLYMRYRGNDYNYDLAKYDGTNLTFISSPTGYENSFAGYYNFPIVVGSTLYMRYTDNTGNFDLARYDGTTLTIIPSPTGYEDSGYGYYDNVLPFVANNILYMNYNTNDDKSELAKYDGTTLTIIDSPIGYENIGYVGSPIVVANILYLMYYDNGGNRDLIKYDGSNLIPIPSPTGYENSSYGYFGNPIAAGSNLYMRYYGNDGNLDLAKYNGTTLTIIPSPAGYDNPNAGYQDSPILFGGALYMQYRGNNNNTDLARYVELPEINLTGNGANIPKGDVTPLLTDHTDFGATGISTPIVRTFTIQNTGAGVLNISSISNTNTADFTVGTAPTSIIAGGSATFTVTLNSASIGTKTATITINSDDADEATYDFAISGRVINATTSGVRGNMVTFNGTNQFINAGNITQLNAVQRFTYETWLFIPSGAWSNFGMIMSKQEQPATGFRRIELALSGTGQGGDNDLLVIVADATNNANYNTTTDVIQYNTWYHVAMVFDGTLSLGTDKLKLYVNGIQQTMTPFDASPVPALTDSNTGAVCIGARQNASIPFRGSLDEARIWNTARTQAQIRESMHLTLSGTETGLVSYYQFNETTGNAIDAVGGNNGTLNNGATRTASTVSVGRGVSKTTSVTSVGAGAEVSLATTNMEIDFSAGSANPNGEIVISQITGETPYQNTTVPNATTSCYWVVRNFGTNTGLAFDNMRFQIPNSNRILTADETLPTNLKLYRRSVNVGGTWTQIASGSTASNTTKLINFTSPTNTSFSEFVIGSTSGALPITLTRFAGERVNGGTGLAGGQVNGGTGEPTEEVKLTWETASEINNKGFEVEMSEDGLAYQKIAFVEGRGTSNVPINYQLTTINQNDSYYRLKQVDFDGTFSYSPVVFVEGMAGKVVVYPNPSKGTFTISTQSPLTPEGGKVRLFNVQGIEVPFKMEGNKITISPLGLGAFPAGVYFLHTVVAGKAKVTKVVVER